MPATTPLSNSEWSAPYQGSPPPSLGRYVDSVIELVEGIGVVRGGPESFPVPDRPRIVSIFGSRGTGKSTALHFTAHKLKADRHNLVLPVIDPESFAAGDSLAGWVLAYVDQLLSEEQRKFEPSRGEGRTLQQKLDDLRRAQAVRAAEYLPGLGRRGLSFDDFARDAMKIPAHGVRMNWRLAGFLDGVAESLQAADLRLIVAVDDADLFPELLPAIVSDAQLLGSSARVTVIFAADLRTMARSLQIAYLSTHASAADAALRSKLLEPGDVRELVSKRLVKHFPRSLRISLPTLNESERLDFKPLDAGDMTVIDLLDRLPLEDGSDRSLADLFLIKSVSGKRLAVSPYTLGFSENARDLRQLHEALAHVDPAGDHAASRALGVIMEHGMDNLAAELPPTAIDGFTLSQGGERPSVQFDFTGIAFGKGNFGAALAYRHRLLEDPTGDPAEPAERQPPFAPSIVLRRVGEHYTRVEAADESPAEPDAEAKRFLGKKRPGELPTQYTHLALLAWEAVQGEHEETLLANQGFFGSPALPGGKGWADSIAGEPSSLEWNYWNVPLWEGYSDYFAYQEGWSRVVGAVRGMRDRDFGDPAPLELACLAHLDLVCSVQNCRAVPDWVAELDGEKMGELTRPGTWEAERERLKERCADGLVKALAASVGDESTRASDYVSWFYSYLPLSATPALTTRPMSEWIVAIWRSQTPAPMRERCAIVISEKAAENMKTSVADADIELLEMVESDPDQPDQELPTERAQQLRDLRREFGERSVQVQTDVLRHLAERQVNPAVLEALQAEGATRPVLLELMRANLKPEVIAAISNAFPETPIVSPDDERREPRDFPSAS